MSPPPSSTRPPLDRRRVLAAAVDLADAEGLAALTMRRLAAALGIEAMSLYHYVENKDALLDGLVEAVMEQITDEHASHAAATGDWRAVVRRHCLLARDVMLRHPWAPGLIAARSSVPAAAIAHYEAVLAAFVDGGLDYALGHRGLHALGSMILGFVSEPFSPAAGADEGAEDIDPEQFAAAMPHLAQMMAAELHAADDPTLGWCDSQTEFEFTLDLLLDGLARHHAAGTPLH